MHEYDGSDDQVNGYDQKDPGKDLFQSKGIIEPDLII
jgi:hypothetical protein